MYFKGHMYLRTSHFMFIRSEGTRLQHMYVHVSPSHRRHVEATGVGGVLRSIGAWCGHRSVHHPSSRF